MALLGARSASSSTLCLTNKSLRWLVAGLLGTAYTASQMSYDLRRRRIHGLIARVLRTNTYVVTPEGIRVAVFYTKLRDRLLAPLLEADSRRHLWSSVVPSTPSTRLSRPTSRAPVSGPQPEICHKIQRLEHQEALGPSLP